MRLPQWVIKAIDKIRRHFLWHGVAEQSKKIHLANWELVTTPKSLGGLGVPDLSTFNSALLMKWQWNWQKPERTLWKPIIQHTVTVINFIPQAPLFIKTLAHAYDFYNMSTIHKLGSGAEIAFWNHDWGLGFLKDKFPNLLSHAMDKEATVESILNTVPLRMNFRHILTTEATQELTILQQRFTDIRLIPGQQDGIHWRWSKNGLFTVKSAYMALKNMPRIASEVHNIWKIKASPRIIVFGWLVCKNRILTLDNLTRRGWQIVNRCILCKRHAESVRHLFCECPFSLALYNIAIQGWRTMQRTAPLDFLLDVTIEEDTRSTLLITQFILWRERCSRTFRESNKNLEQLLEEIQAQKQYLLRE